MPLIKCSMCDKDISPNAISCPHCGEPMNNNSKTLVSDLKSEDVQEVNFNLYDIDGGISVESDNTFIKCSNSQKVDQVSNGTKTLPNSTNVANSNIGGLEIAIFIIIVIFAVIILTKAPILWLVVVLWLFCKC